ncbi:unnamed protein product [Peronospora effusa]|nr:unnamed protein product [Peronospora effusa]
MSPMPCFETNDTPSTAARVADDDHERAAAPTAAAAATPAAPASAMVVDFSAHERGENSDISARILTAPENMTSRMDRLEMSQMQIDKNERLRGAIDSGLFDSSLGRGIGGVPMNREALEFMPPRQSPVPQVAPLPRLRAPVMVQPLFEPLGLRVLQPQQQKQAPAMQQAYAQQAYEPMQQKPATAPVAAPVIVILEY